MNKTKLTCAYLFFDILAALVTWVGLYMYRKHVGESADMSTILLSMRADSKFCLGLLLYPLYWLFFHAFFGYYNKIYRKSRLDELVTTFGVTLFGCLVFFFVFILDDIVTSPNDYVKYLIFLFFWQFILTYIPRLSITTYINKRIHNGQIGFNTIIVGHDEMAVKAYETVLKQQSRSGHFFIGYIRVDDTHPDMMQGKLECVGNISDIAQVVDNHHVEEIVVALHNGQRKYVQQVLALVRRNHNLTISMVPQEHDVLMGSVKTSSVLDEPLISVTPDYLPTWQRFVKRGCDILLSLIAMVLLLPVYIFLAIGVKRSSKGPIFYMQERIGYLGKPFNIIKFRSMCENAETDKPMLSSDDDPRITPFGKFMRQYRLDETPQFFNVLRGDMSLVGPRPERQYYIDQIMERAPYYQLLLGVKPGITSWGQVRFGYAENVDEMIERLRWDILYIENMSILMDIKILIYTVLIILKREGK
jgi:exopolysaccharide biosynthesis polyprenyl glycosylphosphotransferase